MEKKLTERDIKSHQKKKKIYKAAMRLFKKYGYEQVTMKMIAAESEMSEGSIYHFFGEKAGILDYVLVGMQEELLTILTEDKNDQDPRETILEYLVKELALYESLGRDLVAIVMRRNERAISPAPGELPELMKVIQPALTEMIQKNLSTGRLNSPFSAYEIAYILTAQGAGLTGIWSNYGENYSLSESGNKVFQLLISRLFPDAPKL